MCTRQPTLLTSRFCGRRRIARMCGYARARSRALVRRWASGLWRHRRNVRCVRCVAPGVSGILDGAKRVWAEPLYYPLSRTNVDLAVVSTSRHEQDCAQVEGRVAAWHQGRRRSGHGSGWFERHLEGGLCACEESLEGVEDVPTVLSVCLEAWCCCCT
ncbi:hypothetical protein GY45DRAFT_605615 [Cubamyces sp. BRFM 1775]|nr:hypothetical protein GY45DRAFT_605615 [Cubamyces sp. BRFM 1775]